MSRRRWTGDFHVPLLIGGATTSRTHTAVKIAPNYKIRWCMWSMPRARWACHGAAE